MTTDADHPGADGAARGAETDQLDAESFPSLVPDQPSFKVTPLCNEQTANDKTTPKQVKVVVHIVIGLKCIGLFVKIGDELLRPEAYLPYYAEPDHPGVDAVRRHEAAGDEFAPVRLTGHAFDDPRANALAVRLMRAGLRPSWLMTTTRACACTRSIPNIGRWAGCVLSTANAQRTPGKSASRISSAGTRRRGRQAKAL